MRRLFVMLFLIAWVTGCGSIPLAERQKNATTEVSEKWSRDQKERIKAVMGAVERSPDGGTVEWSVDSSEAGNGDQSLLGGLENSIPAGIKLIYLGIGIMVIVFALGWVRKSSVAARAAMDAADRGIANAITRAEAELRASTSAESKAVHLATLSDLEKARGQATRRK